MSQSLTLTQANRRVAEAVQSALPYPLWLQAELSEVRESGGHCYMDLIEKDPTMHTPVARAQARCWRSTWQTLRPRFEQVTGNQLAPGMQVLMQCTARFHEQYGFSWTVLDIDPTFTLGDMARRRLEIINQLKAEGVFDMNKQLPLPHFCQRIAVISSAGAAGYGDFCRQLSDSVVPTAAGDICLAFHTELFAAIMQGEQVEQSVIDALCRINERINEFDCVVIIRGGGATSDLSGFDTLLLAEYVANFPLPVITGIGHERDESVLDLISHTRVKTPTAAATFLVDHLLSTFAFVNRAQDVILTTVRNCLERETLRLQRITQSLPLLAERRIANEQHRLQSITQSLPMLAQRHITTQQHRLQLLEQRAEAQNPLLLLKRGYTITLHNGRTLRSTEDLQPGDQITTITADGKTQSEIIEV